MSAKLTNEEGRIVEDASGQLADIRERLHWLESAELFDDAMVRREVDVITKQLRRIATDLGEVGNRA